MGKDLTNSNVDRQNILNNQYALNEIQKAVKLQGIIFEHKLVFLIDDLADFFTEDENKEHEKWVKEEQRKDIGLKITNPNTDFPNTLGDRKSVV